MSSEASDPSYPFTREKVCGSSYPLTREEAFNFIEHSLGIPTSQICTTGKSLHFLNYIIKEMDRTLPFTNINVFIERQLSNLKPEDWKNHVLSGEGGTCRCKNPFMKALLECLGYSTVQIPANNPRLDETNQTHVATLVYNVSFPGSRHLVDTAIRWPIGEAIPIDFSTESPEYSSYLIRRKFFKIDNDFLHFGTANPYEDPEKHVMNDASGAKWEIRMVYWLNKRADWMEFNKYCIEHEPIRKRHDRFRFYGFMNEKRVRITCSDGQMQATICNMKDQTMEKIVMKKAEFIDFFQKHYPQYSVTKLEKVCEISKVT